MPKPPGRKAEAPDSLLLESSLIALRKALAGSGGSREQPVSLLDSPQLAQALQLSHTGTNGKNDVQTIHLIGAGAPVAGG